MLDIWKPWPIRLLQRLPGGWGVVLDDVAAGMGAGLLLLLGTQGAFLLRLVAG
jgi:phosphatidylglycerophosphatase A